MCAKLLFWHFTSLGKTALPQDGGNMGSLHLTGTVTSFKYTRKLFIDALTNSEQREFVIMLQIPIQSSIKNYQIILI